MKLAWDCKAMSWTGSVRDLMVMNILVWSVNRLPTKTWVTTYGFSKHYDYSFCTYKHGKFSELHSVPLCLLGEKEPFKGEWVQTAETSTNMAAATTPATNL
jgi:tRNA U38,U39,U40 pseudouridine synthase TruA